MTSDETSLTFGSVAIFLLIFPGSDKLTAVFVCPVVLYQCHHVEDALVQYLDVAQEGKLGYISYPISF